ncbi:NUDIX hydrolase [Algirhabdus cladophorae]|uniref:NUDIX hydrolase n=1 Tax=Algirhabdus cladophorae TaxID=3377108 RepID=UPI003B8471AA
MKFNELTNRLSDAASLNQSGSSDYDLNKDVVLPDNRQLCPAAVLVGVQDHISGPRVLLTKRPSTMKHHPGQIAFPGGKQDKTDSNLAQTALREGWEEIGVTNDQCVFLGSFQSHETVTGFQVEPNLFALHQEFEPTPNAHEVSEAFWVPATFVLDPGNFLIQSRRWRGARRHYYVVPYGPYYIWGATARILFGLAQGLKQ